MSGLVRSVMRPLARAVRDHVLPHAVPPPRADRVLKGDDRAVRVVGLLSSATGLGQSARLCVERMRASGYDVQTHDVSPLFGVSDGVAYNQGQRRSDMAAPDGSAAGDAAVSIYHLNPPQLLPGLIRAGLPSYYRSFNIGYWAWELETLPDDWIAALDFVDAVMVPSRFCRDAVRRATDKPVCIVPHPVAPIAVEAERRRDEIFTALCVFNFGSSFARKNPLAAVRAFQLAFGADASARLVLKTSAGGKYERELQQLREATQGAPNIEIVDAVMSETQLGQLYERADVFISLHRSEGFGLPIAEAMMHKIPVVTTAWSGNLDFCTPETALLVETRLVPFADADRSYARVSGGRWAEPSVESAAEHLAALRADPVRGRRLAERAHAHLLRHVADNTYAEALRALKGSGL